MTFLVRKSKLLEMLDLSRETSALLERLNLLQDQGIICMKWCDCSVLPSLFAGCTALAQDSNKDLLELAGQALCRQFGTPYVEALGHGSLCHLVTRCAEERPEPSRVVLPLHAFCLVQGGQGAVGCVCGGGA